MDTLGIVVTVITLVISGFVMARLVSMQRKRAESAFGMLGTRGSMTLDELAAATGTNLVMKGYLMQALDALVLEGKLQKIVPPKGHPAMRIFRDTRYGLPAA